MTTHLDTEKIHSIQTNLDRPVVLTGMMGTGKSHIGKLLADALDLPFYDSDQVIEKRGGISINEIFELYGEEKFRESECKTILDLLDNRACIIATGGGALTTPDVLKGVKDKSHSIWLKTDIPTLIRRVEKNKNRPLLKEKDPEQILRTLYTARAPLYEQMHFHLDTSSSDANAVLESIIDYLVSSIN